MNIYRLRATCLCPANNGRDHYDVEVRAEHMIPVEFLQAFFNDQANERLYQEDLVTKAKKHLAAEVTITGAHPATVTVEAT